MNKWNLTNTLANPPHGNQIPTKLEYIRHYAINMAYITTPHNTEPLQQFKQTIYAVLQKMAKAGTCLSSANTQVSHGSACGTVYTKVGSPTK
jgi:hypothetical protein